MITVFKYNDVDIHAPSAGYVLSSTDIITSPDNLLSFLENQFKDGAHLLNKKYARRIIPIKLVIYNEVADQQQLKEKVEYIKRILFSVEEKQIEFGWGDADNHIFFTGTPENMREEYFIDRALAEVKFDLNCRPFYDDNTSNIVSEEGITTEVFEFSVTSYGHSAPDPIYTITVQTSGNLTAIEIENLTLGERIRISPEGGFNTDDTIIIQDDKVTLGNEVVDYSGVVPEVEVGINNLKISFLGGTIFQDQSQGEEGTTEWWDIHGDFKMAQSFSPSVAGPCPKVKLKIRRHGYPYERGESQMSAGSSWNTGFGGIYFEAQSFEPVKDCIFYGVNVYIRRTSEATRNPQMQLWLGNFSAPQAIVWAHAVSLGSVPTAGGWVTFWNPSGGYSLTNGNAYRVVGKTGGGSGSSYNWRVDTTNPYPRGNRGSWNGSSWSQYAGQDLGFELLIRTQLQIRLETDNAGVPSNALFGAGNEYLAELNDSNFPVEDQVYDVTVDYPTASTSLVIIDTYHIVTKTAVVAGPPPGTGEYYEIAEASEGTYPGQAHRETNSFAWSSTGLNDLIFTTFRKSGVSAHDVDFVLTFKEKYI